MEEIYGTAIVGVAVIMGGWFLHELWEKSQLAQKEPNMGPNATQMNALENLARRRRLSPENLIAMARVVDAAGNPKKSFKDLYCSEAIKVIWAAQL